MFKTIGTDIEVFAVDSEGKPKSVFGLVGGTKNKPKPIEGLVGGFFLQEDGNSLEFNIPPADHSRVFELYLETITNEVNKFLISNDLHLSNASSVIFDENEIPDPKAMILGCEPDYNAWTRMENESPIREEPMLCTAGGHIHVGTDTNMLDVVKNMDLRLGVPSVLLDNSEASKRRRELYGKAGAMRPKDYGLEYRTLSNFWFFDPKLVKWVCENTEMACNHVIDFTDEEALDIQNTINTGDADAARRIIKTYGLALPL